MKKMIIAVTLVTSLMTANAMAENDMYVGLDVITSNNDFTVDVNNLGSASGKLDSAGFKLKLGANASDGWRVQGYYLRETYDLPLFDSTNDALNEIGVDVIKGFEVTPKFSPYIQAGLGFGWMDVVGYSEDSIKEYSLKIGGGVMYKVIPELELLAGVDFQYRGWQDIQVGSYTLSITEKSTKLYAGVNYHF